MLQVPDSPLTAPWRPEKLIGSIWLSESPSAHPHFQPTLVLLLLVALPSCGCCYPWHTYGKTSLAASCESSVCVFVCVCLIYQGVWRQTGRPGPQLPPASQGKCRQTGWHLEPKPAGPLGRMEREEGTRRKHGRRRKAGRGNILDEYHSTDLVTST